MNSTALIGPRMPSGELWRHHSAIRLRTYRSHALGRIDNCPGNASRAPPTSGCPVTQTSLSATQGNEAEKAERGNLAPHSINDHALKTRCARNEYVVALGISRVGDGSGTAARVVCAGGAPSKPMILCVPRK